MPTISRLSGTLLVITAMAVLPVASAATALARPIPAALAGPGPAAKTWTVKPGGKITGKSSAGLSITDTTSKLSILCKPASLGATLKPGSGLPAGIGTITSFTINSSGCTVGSGLAVPVLRDAATLSWPLTASSYNAKTGVTSGTIGHIHLAASASGCSVTVDGTGATAKNGTVNISYTNKTHVLAILASTGNLHLYNPSSGCGGVIHNKDALSMSASYTVTPAQTITSP